MQEIEPPIWRSIRIPDSFSLHRLHRVLQIVFCRLDYHIYEFQVGERRFQAPDAEAEEECEDATVVTLADLGLKAGDKFVYIYDFGDWWAHDVVVEKLLPMPDPRGPDWSPRLLDGRRAPPPEDAGGPSGYEKLVEAIRNPDPDDPEHEEFRAWLDRRYDPERFDAWAVDQALSLAVGWGAI